MTTRFRWLQALGADGVLAIGLFLLNVVELVVAPLARGSWLLAVPAGALLTLPLARRRQAPLLVLLVVVSGYAGQVAAVGYMDSATLLLCWVIAVYSVAAHGRLPEALAGLAVGGVPIWVFLSAHPTREPVEVNPSEIVLLAVPWLAGSTVRRFRVNAQSAELRAEAVARAARAEAELAATNERSRLARELHDVVSHAVSLMVVQAEAGDALFDSDPARARQSFGAVQRAGRQAMTELRSMLGVLRDGGADGRVPRPSLAALPRLIDSVREAGLEVDLEVDGDKPPLPDGVDLCVYRVIQEGLTNALKHSDTGHASVTLRYTPEAVEVEIEDSGDHRSEEETGYGLVGVRERVSMYGGVVTAGPRPQGGFALKVRVPVAMT